MSDEPPVDGFEAQTVSGNQSFKAPAASASLFPAYAGTAGQHAAGWLQNASFPAMAPPLKPAPSADDLEARSTLSIVFTTSSSHHTAFQLATLPAQDQLRQSLCVTFRAEATTSCRAAATAQ